MLLWLKNAPIFDPHNENSRIQTCNFIDEIITTNTDDLSDDIRNVQIHKHTDTCRKGKYKKEICRFGIPYFPASNTVILEPLPEDYPSKDFKKHSKLFEKIKSQLDKEATLSMTFEGFLNKLKITEDLYILALRSSLQRSQIFIKRNPKDIFISPFSKKMLLLMRSNQNCQFVLDAYGAAAYIIDYINKSNRGISTIMKNVLEEVREGNESLRKSLAKISNTFYNNSELSIQEACYNILQLPLSYSSEESVFIPTFPKEDRIRMVKSREKLSQLHRKSDEIFQEGLIEHYMKRPRSLQNLTLSEFAADYRFSSKNGKNSIALKNNSGYIFKRRNSRVIRYRNYYYEEDPENYIREHLMLFLPWRNEEANILQQDMEKLFNDNEAHILSIKRKFNAIDDLNLAKAFQEASDRNDCEDETFIQREKFDFDDYSLNDNFTYADVMTEFGDKSTSDPISFVTPSKMTEENFQLLFESLNQEQKDYVMHVVTHLEKHEKQFLHFLTGGAGVGKTRVIKTLYQALYRLFNASPESNPDDIKILLCTPTGKASFNIQGQTLHSAFRLPLNQKKINHLSASVANTLSTKLYNLKVLIIDEISMVGQHTLDLVDQRLRHIKGIDKPFGGVSVIAVGDFYQLRPVKATPLFNPYKSNPYSEIFGTALWPKFQVFQLKTIMRQKNKTFQNALNNLAKGKLTKKDIKLFETRCFRRVPKKANLQNAVHLFRKNKDVDEWNKEELQKIPGQTITCKASDVLQGRGTLAAQRQILYRKKNSKVYQTMGLRKKLKLKVGARYMMTYNISTEDGLCNGATGILKKIDMGTNKDGQTKPLRLWVKFDDKKTGQMMRRKNKHVSKQMNIPKSWTPVEPTVLTITTQKNSTLRINRKQFPLTLAHALTIHKSQGQSLKKVVLHLSKGLPRDLLYVACSRATSLQGLYIIGNFKPPSKLERHSYLALEMKRWKRKRIVPKFQFLHESQPKKLKILYHNIQSLIKHHRLVTSDDVFTNSDILIFAETWTSISDDIQIPGFKKISTTDADNLRKPKGVTIYIRNELADEAKIRFPISLYDNSGRIEASTVTISNTTIMGLYARPKTSISLWKQFFKMLPSSKQKNLIILGDFNIDQQTNRMFPKVKHLLHKHHLTILNRNQITTHLKTSLDWVVSNMHIDHGCYNSFFSYHYPIWVHKVFTHPHHPQCLLSINCKLISLFFSGPEKCKQEVLRKTTQKWLMDNQRYNAKSHNMKKQWKDFSTNSTISVPPGNKRTYSR